jgi:DNA topoisomerase-1
VPTQTKTNEARIRELSSVFEPEEIELVYVTDEMPGITRRRARTGFTYRGEKGNKVDDEATLRRIKKLAIPPAWEHVWICPVPNGHLQVTGRDAKDRKQYRYHEHWREIRDQSKYERTIAFAEALPSIREQVEIDLAKPGLPREKVLATVVRLLESTLIRVGNREYAKQNGSFGLTTMRDRHVKIDGAVMRFEFRGKSGKQHSVTVRDRRLARIVGQCQEIKGHELFQYVDEDGERQQITSSDVNDYLKQISGDDFTAKDFRTWAGTVLAAMALRELDAFESETQAKHNLVSAVESVAKELGNTPAICRKCYVHPDIVDSYLDGGLVDVLKHRAEDELADPQSGLKQDEALVLTILRDRLQRASSSK